MVSMSPISRSHATMPRAPSTLLSHEEASKITIETAQALQDCVLPPPRDVDVTLTVYPGVGHDAWDHAYSGSQGQDIYTWMLSRSTT